MFVDIYIEGHPSSWVECFQYLGQQLIAARFEATEKCSWTQGMS